jgi:hypothetical protein
MSTLSVSPGDSENHLQRNALVVGGVVLLLCAVAAPFSPPQFFRAYLTAYLFFLGLALGSLATLMIYHLTGGAWGYLIRHNLESATRTLPLLAVLFVPIAFGLTYLYPWAQKDLVAASERLQHKQIYLNEPFFWARAAVYFVLWGTFAYLLDAWSRRQDQSADGQAADRLGRLSGGGLVIYGITMMFSSIDWLMSLEPMFRSTIFGPLFASSQLLSAFAFALIMLTRSLNRPAVNEVISPTVLNDLGNLLLTFLVLWAYMVFFQFMLVWIANLPWEVLYYLPRSRGGWLWVALALVAFNLIIPFFLLLVRDIKRDPTTLARIAGLILFMQLVFLYYEVMPAFPNTSLLDHWMDFLTPIGMGGLWLAYFLWHSQRRPLLVAHDINRAAAVHLHQVDLEEAAHEQEIDDE